MKLKRFDKKLSLNKSTVVNLNQAAMKGVKGGTETGITCWYCDSNESCSPEKCDCYDTQYCVQSEFCDETYYCERTEGCFESQLQC